MTERRRFKQTESLKDRLLAFARLMREQAATMSPGGERNAVLAKAHDAETAIRVDQWVRSSELKPPR